jgi:hypothetical protein
LLAWEAALDLPSTADVLASPRTWDVPTQADRTYAVLAGVLHVARASDDPAVWTAASDAIAHTVDAGHADVAVHAARRLLAHAPEGFSMSRFAAARYPRFLGLAGLLRAA